MDFLVIQALTGLASASSLFLVASGLTLIFGVTRIVNFAHGSLFMLGAYGAWTFTSGLGWAAHAGPLGFWGGVLLSALAVAALGALVEVVLLRRIYQAPALFPLLATFGLALMIEDLVRLVWGPEDLLGPRAPGLEGAVTILGQKLPAYDLALIALGPMVLAGLWWVLHRTHWGVLVRAATQDRAMVGALGVDQSRLFTGVFALGAFLAALGGAVQVPREAVHHALDMQVIVEAFVIVVVGGLGNVVGAFLAAVLVAELNAFGILLFPRIGLVLLFLVMAVVLVLRPHGLLGRPEGETRAAVPPTAGCWRPAGATGWAVGLALAGLLALLPLVADAYVVSVAAEILIFALFAASLHLMMGVGGMVSFGHAAWFGLGAYGAALAALGLGAPMAVGLVAGPLLAVAGATVAGWFCVRLSGVFLAMLTLAFAQIAWSVVFQWHEVTGGDNGLLGIWPDRWASDPAAFYWVSLAVCGVAIALLRSIVFSPFGYALRACRDSVARAEAIGIDRVRVQWLGFVMAGGFAGLAGALYAYLKGSVFPEAMAIPVSIDGLVMVLLGGLTTLVGPVVGAVAYKTLAIVVSSWTDHWPLVLGGLIVLLVIAAPDGLAGLARRVARAASRGAGPGGREPAS
ncbi:ABC transporter permease [Roseospira visakhapatnamensis]|uniref:Branched-chain amino acid transport system permease protein n=1 Tax=Roseospira visakhapatnamensis TaxID=390880 RepID=A0A7W6RH77_9PROT|nr:ABC transporter permease [Roseospira visakhapatnamensis]MBB4267931.1 branched-chain amino acid transport system permease protein [Roseospira visakhapatnamensis]